MHPIWWRLVNEKCHHRSNPFGKWNGSHVSHSPFPELGYKGIVFFFSVYGSIYSWAEWFLHVGRKLEQQKEWKREWNRERKRERLFYKVYFTITQMMSLFIPHSSQLEWRTSDHFTRWFCHVVHNNKQRIPDCITSNADSRKRNQC